MTDDPDRPFRDAGRCGGWNQRRPSNPPTFPTVTAAPGPDPQQRACLNLVKPPTIVEGFALLSVPSSFVQNEIERHLDPDHRMPRAGWGNVELGVRIAPATEDNAPGTRAGRSPTRPTSIPRTR